MAKSASAVLAAIRAQAVIALIRADGPANLLGCAKALSAGGLNCIELTMTTPGAIDMLAEVSRELPQIMLGLGTVLDADTASAGIAAGAQFIVTPIVRPEVIKVCRDTGAPVLCGALTPTEIYAAWEQGADVVKIFPAEFFGPAYIKSIKAPFPQVELLPTGGVTPETVGDFLRAGAFATAAGSALVSAAALKARDWAAITARARQFVAATRAAQ
ncbi:MAG TPA: bifunctional 4-hydroxy-2-oxoglutarate aldolase/2-dehydro-3-deoxy-phosphogluconate aldolase [Opitutaceae bacterium]|nr:bifunctional 4-hydroxy-2-oxoglutarate aldolase/2-dehydro-3-deoxy-phosphogluconate aldolase [Opitutaceae bacterium]